MLRNLIPGGKQPAAPTPEQQAAAGGTSCHVLGIGHGVHRGFLDGRGDDAWAVLACGIARDIPNLTTASHSATRQNAGPARVPRNRQCVPGTSARYTSARYLLRASCADIASLSGGVAQYVVDGEDVAVKAGFLKKCALNVGALSR